ncbi:hypothetical protein [Kribbella sp. VKM Ac-2566]|uniref:hypothetical protein n=1 Tax=Kribbella sp. VKM Ac-2566 TaxID=2512218 RepID=UPI0010628946|nr:hypothetical protein [Kribbella sp. VKM Ac-2566]TDW97932.1 hypothetical protein EV647_2626 [Kribbella sp. VKM Ac-2566]
MTPVPRVAVTPTTGPHQYAVKDLWSALPDAYGTHLLGKDYYPYPPRADWKPRTDPLAGRTVSPELCRDVIRYVGVPGVPGDFVAPATPGVAAFAALGPTTGPARPFVSVNIVELAAPLGDRLLDQRQPTPAECAHVQVDGRELASVVERPLPGFGVRARYIVRTYPIAGKTWTERTLQYRTATYVVLFRLDAYANPEAAFLAFAGKTRDGLTSALKG